MTTPRLAIAGSAVLVAGLILASESQASACGRAPASVRDIQASYWAGLAVGAAGAAAGSQPHWEFARQVFRQACTDIAPDGTLALELARQKRALWYHNFALAPLVQLAEIAAMRGEDWYAVGDGALHRLAAQTTAGIADPARFEAVTGFKQDLPGGEALGWMEPYTRRFPGRISSCRASGGC